jgi:hypothetical protein
MAGCSQTGLPDPCLAGVASCDSPCALNDTICGNDSSASVTKHLEAHSV